MLPSVKRNESPASDLPRQNDRQHSDGRGKNQNANQNQRFKEPVDGQGDPKRRSQPGQAVGRALGPDILPDVPTHISKQRLNGGNKLGTIVYGHYY